MTASLLDIPDELLLLIFEIGRLESNDGTAVSLVRSLHSFGARRNLTRVLQTCRRLYQASQSLSYWLAIAKNMGDPSTYPPLPLPLFKSLSDLSLSEIRDLCINRQRSLSNLDEAVPKYRRRWTLPWPLPPGARIIELFGFLPGERHLLTFFDDGLVQLWDIYKDEVLLDEAGYPCQKTTAEAKPLAQHQLGNAPFQFECQACGTEEEPSLYQPCPNTS